MTKEDAKDYIREWCPYGKQDEIIKALSNSDEDCISRRAVLEYIEGSEAELGHSSENELVCQYIKELPPVTPKPKTGRWINQHVIYTNATIDFKVCSECRYEFSYDAETGMSDANYCPNCGAKMAGPQESEDKK